VGVERDVGKKYLCTNHSWKHAGEKGKEMSWETCCMRWGRCFVRQGLEKSEDFQLEVFQILTLLVCDPCDGLHGFYSLQKVIFSSTSILDSRWDHTISDNLLRFPEFAPSHERCAYEEELISMVFHSLKQVDQLHRSKYVCSEL